MIAAQNQVLTFFWIVFDQVRIAIWISQKHSNPKVLSSIPNAYKSFFFQFNCFFFIFTLKHFWAIINLQKNTWCYVFFSLPFSPSYLSIVHPTFISFSCNFLFSLSFSHFSFSLWSFLLFFPSVYLFGMAASCQSFAEVFKKTIAGQSIKW